MGPSKQVVVIGDIKATEGQISGCWLLLLLFLCPKKEVIYTSRSTLDTKTVHLTTCTLHCCAIGQYRRDFEQGDK